MAAKTEKNIEKDILNYAREHLTKDVLLVKLNNVGVFDPIKKIYRKPMSVHLRRGMPDIIGCSRDGRMIMCEVKTPKTIIPILKHKDTVLRGLSYPVTITETVKNQILLLEEFKMMGAIAFFTDSVDNFLRELRSRNVLLDSLPDLFH